MIRFRRFARFALLLVPLFLSAQQEIQTSVPRIEWADLPAVVQKSPDLKTGFLVVPERRFPEPNGRTISLPFVIMKSRSASPRPDPVLFMTGGPGGSTLIRGPAFRQLRASRRPRPHSF